MIRIRTPFAKHSRVLTIKFSSEWVTLYTINNKTSSLSAETLSGAGQNHLQACKIVQSQLKELSNDGGLK